MANDVYVVGTDMIKFGRFPNRTVDDLGAESALGALSDAGLKIQDIQALYCSNVFQAMGAVGQRVLKQIGQTGIEVMNVTNACASGATAFRLAYLGIKSGEYECTMAVGVEQMGSGLQGGAGGAGMAISPEGILGSNSNPAVFAHTGLEHTRKYGTTFAQFAQISVKNHHHSTLNPKAMYQKETPLEEVMSSEMISYPNTKLMCSVNVDGSAAAILMSEKEVKKRGLMSRAVKVRASALSSEPYVTRDISMQDFNAATRLAADAAYERGSVGPDDINLVELHDCFATAEMVHYENLRLCKDGEAGAFLDSGATTLGGKVPVNVSGGLLSKGHPIGATGVANVYEIVQHLRGEAGARQVEGARMGMTHVVGMGTACAVHILEKV
ncbi:MAG: thiolase family protein [Caulobacterales bacterium]